MKKQVSSLYKFQNTVSCTNIIKTGENVITFAGFIIFHYKLHVSVLFKWNCTWLKDQWPFGH